MIVNDKCSILWEVVRDDQHIFMKMCIEPQNTLVLNNITNFCKRCDILTYEFEDIDIQLFPDINIEIYPQLNLLEIIQDKYIQKKYEFNKVVTFLWSDIKKIECQKIKFNKFDFEHELAILYSSGTTGKPKCICHRSGGVLLQHLKEH